MRTGLSGTGLALILVFGGIAGAQADVVKIRISDLEFVPAAVSARVGDTIEWSNADFVPHAATARGGEWNVEIAEDGTGRLELRQAGDVEYYCKYHPMMVGRIHVSQK